MAGIVVEPGDGSDPLANSYCSMDYLDSYNELRNNMDWVDSSEDDKKIASAIYAADWLSRLTWYGIPLTDEQPLPWPRYDIYSERGTAVTGVPEKVKQAQAELSLIYFRTGVIPGDDVVNADAGEIQSVTAGSVSVTYKSSPQIQSWSPRVYTLLRGLTRGISNIAVVRA